ncbi:MAG: LAGLIDADG family homing endonuclease [Minisyncoccia bacterium]
MSEPFKYNRLKFSRKDVQKNFILKAKNKLNVSRIRFANKLKISTRTLDDWIREVIDISQVKAMEISKISNMPIPKNHKIVDWKLHWQKAGRKGAKSRMEKYGKVGGDENYRKKKWNEWWQNVGKHKKLPLGYNSTIKILQPQKSKLLAEFVGILLGDGHISNYQVTVTLSSKEKDYILYVQNLINNLFGVMPTIIKQRLANAVTIVVSRKLLVDFCQKFGFKKGNKVSNKVDIPEWIKKDKKFSIACIRGLIDTDGCFFNHTYTVGGKSYSYLKMAFTSASVPLRESVKNILINSGFSVRMSKERKGSSGRDVRIDGFYSVNKYIKEIGSHNKKHLDKIIKWKVALNGKAAVC